MNIQNLLKGLQAGVKTNSPAILTGLAVAGTVTTALLAAQAGWKAGELIAAAERTTDDPIRGIKRLSTKEKAKICWPLFVPAAGMGVVTITCALGANHISSRRVAAFTSAYTISETAFREYKDKVIEQFGETKEQKVRDAVMQDRVTENAPNRELIIVENGDVICYEAMMGRYFKSTPEKIRKAVNDINSTILHDMYASLNDFWEKLGIPGTPFGDEVGWTTENLLEIEFTSILDPEKKPVLAINYPNMPKAGYYNLSL